jgi:hypothetical protein
LAGRRKSRLAWVRGVGVRRRKKSKLLSSNCVLLVVLMMHVWDYVKAERLLRGVDAYLCKHYDSWAALHGSGEAVVDISGTLNERVVELPDISARISEVSDWFGSKIVEVEYKGRVVFSAGQVFNDKGGGLISLNGRQFNVNVFNPSLGWYSALYEKLL